MRRAWLLAAVILAGCADHAGPRKPTVLSVATFNAWGAGGNQGKTVDETVAVLEAINADIIGLQEVRAESDNCSTVDCPPIGSDDTAGRLAAKLGYELHEQRGNHAALWANAILSRHPIEAVIADDLGVVINVDGRRIAIVNIHLDDYPYQPYQLLGIPYGDAPMLLSETGAIAAANEARGDAVQRVLETIATLDDAELVVITGDFNEPSHRDWTRRAAAAGRHPFAVAYPTLRAFEQAGFVDTWRAAHPDEMMSPGYTWTPTTPVDASDDHHDRIDYVLVRGRDFAIGKVQIAGESATAADIVVRPWPSDHRAVVATITIH